MPAPHVAALREFNQAVESAFNQLTSAVVQLKSQISQTTDPRVAADYAAVLKRAAKWLEQLKRSTQSSADLAERIACVIWLTNPSGRSIKTDIATCTPKLKLVPKIPHRGTLEYLELMAALMADNTTVDEDALRPHWPGVVAMSSHRAEEGLPTIPGCDPSENTAVYSLTCRLKGDFNHE